MKNLLFSFCLFAAAAFGQYKLEPAGAPPSELAPAMRDALQKDGAKIVGPNGVVCEIWLRAKAPAAAANGEQNASFTDIGQGTFLGAIRFTGKGSDRRGQIIPAGVYTLRLSFYPVDGAHQGVAPTRDFALMTPAAVDQDLNAAPKFEELVKMSTKASGTAHPAILSVWKGDAPQAAPALKQDGEDWVLDTNMGGVPVSIIVVGVYAG
jgi:hypothetical protein